MARVDELWNRRLGLIVAPAGSGKTTLLSQWAARSKSPTAWYRSDGSDQSPKEFVAALETALRGAVPELDGGWASVHDALRAIERIRQTRILLVIDDLHRLVGTPTEAAVELLVDYAPASLFVLAASRVVPGLNLSRLRVAGELVEVGADDLRFRSWEVERLFRDLYGSQLPPEDLATLARRTDGWAAGLQLFHLATNDKSINECRRVLSSFRTGSRLVSEYLTRNVLDELPSDLRSFLLGSFVMGRLNARLCDEFLGIHGSAQMLEELERRQVFTEALDDVGTYRYHEVLRSHLEALFLSQEGEERVRGMYLRAAALLEREGAVTDAFRAWIRGEEWDRARMLLIRRGVELTANPEGWVEALPPAMTQEDPWIHLAKARWHRAAGRWSEALAAYRSAEETLRVDSSVRICRQERHALNMWLETLPATGSSWHAALRAAVDGDPMSAADVVDDDIEARRLFTRGMCALLAGRFGEAPGPLADAMNDPGSSAALSIGSRLMWALSRLMRGEESAERDVEGAAEAAESAQLTWLARLARAVLALSRRPDGCSEAAAARLAFERNGDRWGAAVASLFEGLGIIKRGGDARRRLEDAARIFGELGANTLEVWAASALAVALARAGDPSASQRAREAETRARSVGARAPVAIALAAQAVAAGQDEAVPLSASQAIALECNLSLEPFAGVRRLDPSPEGRFEIRYFGGFRVRIAGRDLTSLSPRLAALLQLLGVHGGRPIHREVLAEALWPGLDVPAAMRNLHVAVSTLRRFLEAGARAGSVSAPSIVREGESYRLALPEGSWVDVVEFEDGLQAGREALSAGDASLALESFKRMVSTYVGDLLPEAGPAEWVVSERERVRSFGAETAQQVAAELLHSGRAADAAWVCRQGLRIDRFTDALWRMGIEAYDAADEPASAARMRHEYRLTLSELGIDPADAVDKSRRSESATTEGNRTGPSVQTRP